MPWLDGRGQFASMSCARIYPPVGSFAEDPTFIIIPASSKDFNLMRAFRGAISQNSAASLVLILPFLFKYRSIAFCDLSVGAFLDCVAKRVTLNSSILSSNSGLSNPLFSHASIIITLPAS